MFGEMSQSKIVSKVVFGVGIIAVGLLSLAVALIIGLQFPNHVENRMLTELCIVDSQHLLYGEWVNDSFRDRLNRVYFWQIDNEEGVLYNGETPKVRERGPYVYAETLRKVAVESRVGTVSYKAWRHQVFQPELTARECPDCTQDDQIRLINTEYLRTMEEYGEPLNFAIFLLPSATSRWIGQLQTLMGLTNDTGFHAKLGELTTVGVDTYRAELSYPPTFQHLSFGSWLSENDTDYKQAIYADRESVGGFSDTEMRGLYDAVSDAGVLGASKSLLMDGAHYDNCQSALHHGSGYDHSIQEVCTFYECLTVGQSLSMQSLLVPNVSECISRHTCRNQSWSCLTLPTPPPLQFAYIRALYHYVISHLTVYVFYTSVILEEDVFVTRAVENWTLGYQSRPPWNTEPEAAEVTSGILEHYSSEEDAIERSPSIVLFNCYHQIKAQTNFMWQAYSGDAVIPEEFFPNASRSQRAVESHYENLPPSQNLTACKDSTVAQHHYVFFSRDFLRKFSYTLDGRETYGGVDIQRLRFNKSNLAVDEAYVWEAGLQRMRGVWGYEGWLGLPHYLQTQNYSDLFDNMNPSEECHEPSYDVEPVTGILWKTTERHQASVGLKDLYLSSPPRPLPAKRPQVYTQPIPLYWVEQASNYNEEGIARQKDRVESLMIAACGGLVGFSLIACIVVLLGCLSSTITLPSGKVAPLHDDSMTSGILT